MVQHTGISPISVRQIPAPKALKPHLSRAPMLSRDPKFKAKSRDVITLN